MPGVATAGAGRNPATHDTRYGSENLQEALHSGQAPNFTRKIAQSKGVLTHISGGSGYVQGWNKARWLTPGGWKEAP